MKDIDILRHEEEFCHKLWRDYYESRECITDAPLKFDHMHVCDFELYNFRYCKNRRQLNKLVERKCKEYLSSIGKERDKWMTCCDECVHDRYMTISEETPELILNISTHLKAKGIEEF